MTLLETCIELTEKIELLQLSRQNLNQRAAIQHRYEEWADVANDLDRGRKVLQWLGKQPADFTPGRAAQAKVKSLAIQAATRLAEGGSADSLVEGTLWRRLLAAGREAATVIDQFASTEWKGYVASLDQVDTPENLQARLPQTPENLSRMETYKSNYRAYVQITTQERPRNSGDLELVKLKAEDLAAVFQTLQFDVPPDVERFFRAVAGGGATLEFLSESVMSWLRENNQLNNYLVRNRTR
jgi:hypothetical protein